MEYDNSLCRYCSYRNSWDCSENYYSEQGCENWSLDVDTLSEKQKNHIKNALLCTICSEDW